MTGDAPGGMRPALGAADLDPGDARPAARAAVRAWLALQARLAFRPQEAAAALAVDPDPRRALARTGERPPPAAELEDAAAQLAALGVRLLPLPAPGYPRRLRRLSDAPPLLLLRGDPAALRAPAVAVVGARAPTGYGRGVAHALARALAQAGRVVVSGLARGIDAAAHEGALEGGGRTLALLGCGPEQIYPSEHRGLAARLCAAGGALVSEFPPGTPPRGANFPLRNRLISALAEAVIVVEARERSGSLVTARLAAEQGVDVLAVPGPIHAATSRGCNRLLYDGATPVLGVEEALRELGVAPGPAPAAQSAPAPAGESPGEAARALLAVLVDQPLSRDALGRRLERSPAALAPLLLELELAGLVTEERDGRLHAAGPLRGARL